MTDARVQARRLTLVRNPVQTGLLCLIRGYRMFISPALPRACKYHPSCSQYAVDALTQYGVMRGLVLAGWRLLRCNPLSYGGYDPVEKQTLFGEGRRSRRHVSRRTPAPAAGCCDSLACHSHPEVHS